MSGEQPQNSASLGQYVTPSDVQQELNFIEDLRRRVSGQDEYLEAILTNQRLNALQLMGNVQNTEGRGLPPSAIELEEDGSPAGYDVQYAPVPEDRLTNLGTLPVDAVGVANRIIYEGDVGPATFQLQGTVLSTNVRVEEDIASGDPIVVEAPGNICEPINDVSLSFLGLDGAIGVDTYNRAESETDVTIQPDETKTVLEVNPRSASWVSVGTNDETHTEYQYFVDGDPLLPEPVKEPLGLYNDPFRFPSPLSVSRSFEVRVTRLQSAPGPADYFSKADYFA